MKNQRKQEEGMAVGRVGLEKRENQDKQEEKKEEKKKDCKEEKQQGINKK